MIASRVCESVNTLLQRPPDSRITIKTRALCQNANTVDQHKKQAIRKDIEALSNCFSSLTRKTLDYLNSQPLELLEKVRSSLASYFKDLRSRHLALFFLDLEALSDILEADSFEAMYLILCKYWSFINYHLLDVIITNFGNADLQSKMEKYKKDVKAFQYNTRAADFGLLKPYTLPKGFSEIKVTMCVNEETFTLAKADTVRDKLCFKSMIERSLLKPTSGVYMPSRPGIIGLVWHMPSFLAQIVANAIDSSFLQENGITEITINGYKLLCESKEQRSGNDHLVVRFLYVAFKLFLVIINYS